jgi:hypothetical protein
LAKPFDFGYLPLVTWASVWGVLKWVLLVLVAGFIGQFGKSLALRIIERRKRMTPPAEEQPQTLPSDAELDRERLEALAKIEKKRAKAEVKRLKKQEPEDD